MNCWEFMKCESLGEPKIGRDGSCLAFPDHGTRGARVMGTLYGKGVQDNVAKKIAACTRCDFYKSEHYDRNHCVTWRGREKNSIAFQYITGAGRWGGCTRTANLKVGGGTLGGKHPP